MISLIIPTRNREKTLQITSPSYFYQKAISEIIFVNDNGNDDTNKIIKKIAIEHSFKNIKIITNKTTQGAAQSRNIGVKESINNFILFCDDDEIMEKNYAQTLLEKLTKKNAAAISGRRIYLFEDETIEQAKIRFGNGMRKGPYFNSFLVEYINGAKFTEDLNIPFTNANILTTKALCEMFPFDPFYSKGNGYREETDFQMSLFVNGLNIYVTNDTHTFHLPLSKVRTGGQRVSKIKKIFWSNYFNYYFINKYYARYSARSKFKVPKNVLLFSFFVFSVYREFLRPFLYKMYFSKKNKARFQL